MQDLKPTSSFKLHKRYKALIATEVDPVKRAALKHNLVQAQLAEQLAEQQKQKDTK